MMETAKTISVPEAGRRYFDLGRNASYDAVKRGEIPVIKIGSRLRVPVSALDRMLEQAGEPKTTSAR
jgi:excisionase family DNA binding protein